MTKPSELESMAQEIERLCEVMSQCIGKSSLYKHKRDTTRKILELAGNIRRGAHVLAVDEKVFSWQSWQAQGLSENDRITIRRLRAYSLDPYPSPDQQAGAEPGGHIIRRYEIYNPVDK